MILIRVQGEKSDIPETRGDTTAAVNPSEMEDLASQMTKPQWCRSGHSAQGDEQSIDNQRLPGKSAHQHIHSTGIDRVEQAVVSGHDDNESDGIPKEHQPK